MKKKQNEMVRNFLYSLCLHILFLLVIFFSDSINKKINSEMISNLNIVDVDPTLFNENIKTTDKDIYHMLSLQEKIDLYKASKEIKDKGIVLANSNSSNRQQQNIYPKTDNGVGGSVGVPTDVNTTGAGVVGVTSVGSVGGKRIGGGGGIGKEYVLYLGPTDYKRYVARLERESKEKQALLDRKKNEDVLGKTIDKVIATESIERELAKNKELTKQVKDVVIVKEGHNDVISGVAGSGNGGVQQQYNSKIDSIISKLAEDETLVTEKGSAGGAEASRTQNVAFVAENSNAKRGNVQNDDAKYRMLMDVDINKIFTKDDLKKIRTVLEEESNANALSVREKLNIQNQLISCYKSALAQTGKKSLVKTSVTINLFTNGIINSKEIKVKIIDDNNAFTKEDYDVAIDNAKIALAYCNPIRNLPAMKYQSWQNINFVFDATE
ncbi:MAG: hypothetical protein IJ853_02350 [Rickettsiales bacterium]|nr:hypothetical protein [Rickettsiales bacterium]